MTRTETYGVYRMNVSTFELVQVPIVVPIPIPIWGSIKNLWWSFLAKLVKGIKNNLCIKNAVLVWITLKYKYISSFDYKIVPKNLDLVLKVRIGWTYYSGPYLKAVT